MPLLPNRKPKKLTRTHQKAGSQPGMRHLGQEYMRQSASSMKYLKGLKTSDTITQCAQNS